jgi:hypothetical protein
VELIEYATQNVEWPECCVWYKMESRPILLSLENDRDMENPGGKVKG